MSQIRNGSTEHRSALGCDGDSSPRPFAGRARAAMTAAEKRNLKLVNDFCAPWPANDLDKVMAFFAETGLHESRKRWSRTKAARPLSNRIKSFINTVQKKIKVP